MGDKRAPRIRCLSLERLLAARDDDDRARPHLPVGVAMLREEGTGARWHIILAGSMFVIAPVLLVFAVAQRQIIRAFTFASLE